jgi:hypothetical protein
MEEKMLTGGLHLSEGEKKTKGVPVRVCSGGPRGLVPLTGPKGFPEGSNSYFSFLSSFLFSDFRFVSKSFAKCFNSNQTNS